jgi:glucan phosphoethanolaminetransferase (alkaline phosphatase superfamily)
MNRFRRLAWMAPVFAIAVLDAAVRWRQVIQWSPKEFAWYGASILYALLGLRISVWLLLPLRRMRGLFWGAVLVQAAAAAWILLVHFNHYLYFGVHPEVISFSQFLNETAETLRVVGAAFTPLNQGFMVALTLVLAAMWRMGLDAPPGWRRGWAMVLLGVLLLPLFHNNVQWGRGNFYPAVNFTFAASKALQFHLQGRTFRRLPTAQRPDPAAVNRPMPYDVLMFASESVRAKSASTMGFARKTTPRMEAFIAAHPEQVFEFARCYTNSIHTNPSVPSMLSGVHPLQFPAKMGRTPLIYEYAAAYPDVATFLFSAQAYETYQFQDFFRSKKLGQFIYQENSGHPPFSFGGMDDRFLLPLLQATVNRLAPHQRFMGILHFNGTHHPYRVPESAVQWGGGTLNDKYDDAIHYQDQIIGEALAQLDATRRLDQTIALFTSDHGEGMEEHGISGHRRAYYEEFIHVPCWLYLPAPLARKHGGALRANGPRNVSNVDWVPTLVELMGLAEQPDVQAMLANLDGKSLLHPVDSDRLIVVHNGLTNVRVLQGFALIRGSQRLLFHPVGEVGKVELYDLAQDPEQRMDLWPTLPLAARQQWLAVIESQPELRDEVRRAPPPGLPKGH